MSDFLQSVLNDTFQLLKYHFEKSFLFINVLNWSEFFFWTLSKLEVLFSKRILRSTSKVKFTNKNKADGVTLTVWQINPLKSQEFIYLFNNNIVLLFIIKSLEIFGFHQVLFSYQFTTLKQECWWENFNRAV